MDSVDQVRSYTDYLEILRRSTDLLFEEQSREEIFSVERLEQYATYLGQQLKVKPKALRGKSLDSTLKKSARELLKAYTKLSDVMRNGETFSPAAEWFVDNFHIVEDQLRDIKRDLPNDFYSELPKLAEGELKNYPRVYAMALAIIAHTDSRLDPEMLKRFLCKFQEVAPLSIGELWAIPITLRIALIENLNPLAQRIVIARERRREADEIADRLLELSSRSLATPESLVEYISETLVGNHHFDRAFVVRLIQRLRDQDPKVGAALSWVDDRLQEHKTNVHAVTQLEHMRQASAQVTVGNIISSMRLLLGMDWRDFFESVSLVDSVLQGDPSGTYPLMDFSTRDNYRHAIERLSKRSKMSEIAIAQKLIIVASEGISKLETHIGYYLIGEAKRRFEKRCGYQTTFFEKISRSLRIYPTFVFLGLLIGLSLVFSFFIISYLDLLRFSPFVLTIYLLLTVFVSSEFALGVFNHYVTFFVKPKKLPRIETNKGIPENAKTMVVVPTLFITPKNVTELSDSLQIHFLANKDPNIFYALLGDFADSDFETMPHDEALAQTAERAIQELNARYPHPNIDRKYFHLFLRRRQWNTTEEKWIGWERKRGKLHEFNRFLRGAKDTSFTHATEDQELLKDIKYVITLDSDTQMPRDVARSLIGIIVHPLNQPIVHEEKRRVVKGYGILQPRVSISHTSSSQTRFSKIFSGNTGLDPYTNAVSDVYQDLFREGIYTGKGLYVVDVFEKVLEKRIPENTLLSHDLFESSFARAALVTDIEFYDDYPSDFESYAKRQHRWVRGDWQIAQWLLPRVPVEEGEATRNTISVISKWKIFDNLRRSLVPSCLIIWLVFTWLIPFLSPLVGSAVFLFVIIFPAYAPLTNSILFRRRGVPWRGHFRNIGHEARIKLGQMFLTIAFLPELAWINCDAIVRVAYRKLFSGKKLLEWVSFAQVEGAARVNKSFFSLLNFSSIFAIFTSLMLLYFRPEALPLALPFLLLWLGSPLIVRRSAEKIILEKKNLSLSDLKTLRRYARRTWHFFETFVGPNDNWLAPDNFQEDPLPIVAHRTSPTNIGLQLLANVSAYDMGYIGYHELLDRLEKTLESLCKMSKFHGHLFNWYDTQTLEPLKPQYISTVDSGNFAGHLLAVKQATLELLRRPFIHPQAVYGLIDSFDVLREELENLGDLSLSLTFVSFDDVRENIETCTRLLVEAKLQTPNDWRSLLSALSLELHRTQDLFAVINADVGASKLNDLNKWFSICLKQVKELERDLTTFAPWVSEESEEVSTPHQFFHKSIPSLLQLRRLSKTINEEENFLKTSHTQALAQGAVAAEDVYLRSQKIQEICDVLFNEMDFRFLFDEQRRIFVIGYSVAEAKKDNSYYDLLASESRLASFIAIAKGDVPQEHWFRLGRQLTSIQGSRTLISWTATMFEYLMPLLVMRRYTTTLLDQTYEAVIKRQIEYGRQNKVPWGVSEAGYNARDLQLNFQYGPFGVPGLGLKRGLSDDLVVSPYSTMLAAMIDPWAALKNLKVLENGGVFSKYGFFESIDYTAERLEQTQKSFVLRSFMAHHQGMSLVALNNVIHKNIMQRRFHQEPIVRATQLLLQEKIPQEVQLTKPRAEEVRNINNLRFLANSNPRVYNDVPLPTPRTQLLSNGTYSLMITSAGSGYSRCAELAVNRWREDVTRDHWGQFFYIRNRKTGTLWSTGLQPTLRRADQFQVTFAEEKVEIWREDSGIVTHTEIIVSQEDNVELRRISLTNNTSDTCDFEVTSFMEISLARPADDAAHPAFSNLFVQTEFSKEENALLATRRRRSHLEKPVWAFHVVVAEGDPVGSLQYETDRARFIGRGRSAAEPIVIAENRPLSGTVGAVLDPIFSLRQTLRIPPGETMRLLYATGVSDTREEALRLADKYHDNYIFAREASFAWTKSQVQLRHLNIESDQAHNYQRLAGRLLFSDSSLRPTSTVLSRNKKTQSSLWAYGISGDLPIILVKINDEKDIDLIRQLLHAHEYMRYKGLLVDLVIINERSSGYIQSLQDEIQRQIQMSGAHALVDKAGGVFVRRADFIPEDDLLLLKTVARVVLSSDKGSFVEQITRRPAQAELPAPFVPTKKIKAYPEVLPALPDLKFFNGLGGFTTGGRYYVIILKENQWTPAPWINVIANSNDFGFLVSESGSGYTWSENSRENRITPWSNDAVSDVPGEIIYIRDEETGEFWTPTPLPVREKELYVIRHSQGYSQFEHTSHGIAQELQFFVSLDDNVKICRLRLKNLGTEKRSLSVTSYVEWVLGFQKSFSSPFTVTEIDKESGAIFARNPYNNEFSNRVSFFDISEALRGFTCDRKEFLGRNGSPANPEAMHRASLSGHYGAGLDPCAALQAKFELGSKEEKEIIVVLGQAESNEAARALALKYKSQAQIKGIFKKVIHFWDEAVGALQIQTPDEAMNVLVNRWLVYQTLSCRIWARSAFYQSGGAFGFRDQLQDVMALLYSKPEVAREQILLSASRQFKEGDVQHWWHPPTGRGVRTRCSDDLLWLPFVSSMYVKVTGDESILREEISFIEAAELEPGVDDSYTQPAVSTLKTSLYDHCLRAIDKSLNVGSHGLPLMGSCDWNDGMSRVGHEGKGESVWVAWFLYKTLDMFIPLCEKKNETERSAKYRRHMNDLQTAVEAEAWDGDWYRRAYFDNGTALGSAANEECRIDSLAQSWAVLSGAGDRERSLRAMNAVDQHLIYWGESLIKLFTPPFDKSAMDPGYIKGYLPGVRENGGQYTHAAIWTLMAYAELGDGERATDLFAMINPISHSSTQSGLYKYKVEPYVMAADIYGMPPHTGRGGWTWYTGSASWMYRAAIESILGFEVQGAKLFIRPCVPKLWKEYSMTYRYKNTTYQIQVSRGEVSEKNFVAHLTLDGAKVDDKFICLVDDHQRHVVCVTLG